MLPVLWRSGSLVRITQNSGAGREKIGVSSLLRCLMTIPSLVSVDDRFMRFCWFSLPPSARALILSRAAKTTWVFGAGASHHYNLNRFGVSVPLASGFFKAFNELPTSQGFGAMGVFRQSLVDVESCTGAPVSRTVLGKFWEKATSPKAIPPHDEKLLATASQRYLSGPGVSLAF